MLEWNVLCFSCIFHEWCIHVCNYFLHFLSCYEVRSTGLVMAWMLEISFILRNFHEQINFPHIFPFATYGMRKCALQKFGLRNSLFATYKMQDAEMRLAEVWTPHFPFRNSLSATCGMRKYHLAKPSFRISLSATCGMQKCHLNILSAIRRMWKWLW